MTAEDFKARRKALWSSIYKAADAMGVTAGAVNHWELGRREVPKFAVKLLDCIEASMKHVAQKSE
jgi:DNA-binding transcriptional regulator YiaG